MAGGYQEKVWKSDQEAVTAIKRAVRDANGSEVKAAELLGISYRTLSRYVTRLGIREELKRLSASLKDGGTAAPTVARAAEFPALASVAKTRGKR